MMTVSTDVAKQAVAALSGTPLILALILINLMALGCFGFVLYQVGNAMERREAILAACIAK